jgi:inositol 1,4,5-triphosphate receptor type 1/inositol 1,4,5-triphosphate receptor type 3
MGVAHLILWFVVLFFHVVAYSNWIIAKEMEQWKDDNPNDQHLLSGPYFLVLTIQFFFSDKDLVYKMVLTMISFFGLHLDFLFFSFHNVHVCSTSPMLSKVFQAISSTSEQVLGTVFLGFSIQYCFLVIGFLLFPSGYGFADKDTSGCLTLLECLVAHLDYGNRSAPVWSNPHLSWMMLSFDYLYNLFVILILAAIISGIIIDTFSSMRAELNERVSDQETFCFICYINKSKMERQMVIFEKHVFQEHYMWSYCRFLMYLSESEDSSLNGPESYVKGLMTAKDYTFYPIGQALSLSSDDSEDYSEKQLRVKDLTETTTSVKTCQEATKEIIQIEWEVKTGLKDSRGSLQDLQHNLSALGSDIQKRVALDQAAKVAAQKQKES